MIYVVANWKMNKTKDESIRFFDKLDALLEDYVDKSVCNVLVAPPNIHLPVLDGVSKITSLVAQNIGFEEFGAYTGETSILMLPQGVEYVLVGHSERRQYFYENNDVLFKKVSICLDNNLKPIFCFGENLDDRESGLYLSIIKEQLMDTILSLDESQIPSVMLAYEPVWAIGTGKHAEPEQINEVHDFVRKILIEQFGVSCAQNIPILYGGSCNSKNAHSILSQNNVNGLLIGGASLDVNHFDQIITIAHELS